MASALLLASAGNTAFFVIFGIFVVAMLALVVIVIMWAVRHDMAGRKAWRARQEAERRRRPIRRTRREPDRRAAPRATGTTSRARRRPSFTDRVRADGPSAVTSRRPAPPRPGAHRLRPRRRRQPGRRPGGHAPGAHRRDIRADRVFGASVGAINGASYAGQPTPRTPNAWPTIWRAVKGTDIFPRGPFDGPWAFLQKRPSVHANSGLRAIIESGIDYENLEDATIPIEVVTTSITDGRERWIGHGPAVEAILASSAIPSIFPPVIIDGDVLVDGGVVNNVPISRALEAGCDRIYVLLCGPLHYHPPPPRRPLEAQLTAFFVAMHARFIRELALLPPGVEVVVFSGGGEPSGQYRDFSATATLIEEGRAEVAEVLDRYAGTSQHLAPADLAGLMSPPHRALPALQRRPRGDGPLHRVHHAVRPRHLPASRRPGPGPGLALLGGGGGRDLGGEPPVGAGRPRRPRPGLRHQPVVGRAQAGAPNVEVVEHDVAPVPPPAGPFDLVHARLVLVHVPERDAALATMAAALRPGGVLLVEDADPALQPLSCPDEIGPPQELANRIRRGFRTLLAERGVDLAYGRTLPRRLRAAGLVQVGADAAFPVSDPACNDLETATINLIRDQLLDHGIATEEEIARRLANVAAGVWTWPSRR